MSARLLPVLLCAVVLAVPSSATAAQTSIHRCEDARGHAAFSQKPCAAAQLRERLPEVAPKPIDRTGFCPAPNLEALQHQLEVAFARHDVNALSGLYHWPSVGRGAAGPILEWLERLLDHQLLGTNVHYRTRHRITAYGITRMVGNDEADAEGLRLILGNDAIGSRQTTELRLVRYVGCWWISEDIGPR